MFVFIFSSTKVTCKTEVVVDVQRYTLILGMVMVLGMVTVLEMGTKLVMLTILGMLTMTFLRMVNT